MADGESVVDVDSDQCTRASGNDTNDDNVGDCRKDISDDAELDDLLEGTLNW